MIETKSFVVGEKEPVVEEKIWGPHQSWVNSDTLNPPVPERAMNLILFDFVLCYFMILKSKLKLKKQYQSWVNSDTLHATISKIKS